MSELDSNNVDRITSLTKGIVGSCPYGGALLSEVIGVLIPNQRIDRIAEFLKALDSKVSQIDSGLEKLKSSLDRQVSKGCVCLFFPLPLVAVFIAFGRWFKRMTVAPIT